MRLGRRVLAPVVVLAPLLAPALTGCGLFDRGSTADEALEYLPADAYEVRFADRAAMVERLGLGDVDPRDASDKDVASYVDALTGEDEQTAVATTELTPWIQRMKDAPLNDFDVEWEASARWGAVGQGTGGGATLWKVGDDVDFDVLAADLEEKGYVKGEASGLPVFTGSISVADVETGAIGGVYPTSMLNVLLDEDEQLVVAAVAKQPLDDVAAVITDHSDSLADDGGMDELLGAADDEPELAWLAVDGPGLCRTAGRSVPEQARELYDEVGDPEARALLVSGDDAEVVLALRYAGGDEAAGDLQAREDLIDEGLDLRTREPLSELGDFSVEREGDLLRIEMDYDDGPRRAIQVERAGAGPGACVREADG